MANSVAGKGVSWRQLPGFRLAGGMYMLLFRFPDLSRISLEPTVRE
jgi:hypothetical protein